MNEINEFITRRWKDTDGNWFNGNCYWFSHILVTRFPQLQIYYLPIEGHFVAGDNFCFYDARGQITLTETPILFEQIKQNEPNWYNRIVNDCIK